MNKWKTVKLGDICEIVTGSTPSTLKQEYWDGSFYWVTPAEISDGDYYIERTQRKLTEAGISSAGLRIMPVGTVLLSSRAPIGKVAITAVEMACNQGFKNLICEEKIHNRFLYYFLKNNKHYLNSLGRGATFKEISKSIVCEIEIPLPPLEEQKRIANILDKASNLIDLRKQQLEKMDLLVKSKFIDMFGDPVKNPKGWKVKSLKDIALGKLSYGSGASATEYDLNVRYIRITDINEKGCLNDFKVSPNEISDEYILREGDILFARSGATVGKTFRYSEKYGKCIYAGYLIRLVPNQKIVLPDYIYYFSRTDYYLSFVKQSMKTVAQPNINAQQYGALQIPIPPLFLQNQFASFVEKVEKQKTVMQQSLGKLEMNYKALMQEYFG